MGIRAGGPVTSMRIGGSPFPSCLTLKYTSGIKLWAGVQYMTVMSIGQVAAETGVTVETIRYYEKKALIPEPPRSPAGYRQFPAATVKRVLFIQRAQELGFSLRDIHALLGLRNAPHTNCAEVKARTEEKLAEVDQKIFALMRIRNALTNLIEQCVAQDEMGDCPILDALEDLPGSR